MLRTVITFIGGAGLALVLALAPMFQANAQDSDVVMAQRLREAALADRFGYRFVETLTTTVGQRLAGTAAETRASLLAERTLLAAGFDNVHRESFPITAWIRGREEAEVTVPSPQRLVVAALGGSVATPPGGIEAEIVVFPLYAQLLAAAPGLLDGKIAVVTEAMPRVMDGSSYSAAIRIRRSGPSEAAKRGAIAYLHRSLGTDNHRLAHAGATAYQEGVRRIPAAALSVPDAQQLARMAALGKVSLRLVLMPTSDEHARSWTVSGEVRGSERPDEIVLIGAHLDSWDLGTGAIDDGAGVGIALGAGNLIAQLKPHPKRTLRVVLFGAEEMNYSGPAYAKMHADEIAHIVLAGEADFGARRVYTFLTPASAASTPFLQSLTDALSPLEIFLTRQPATFGGDDIAPLHDAGVPVFSLRQNGIDYFDIHHTADDTFDKIDPQELAQATAAWVTTVYFALQSELDFRQPGKESKN
jgi:Zn-dependent M28 family amino/carboxypeptidase